MTADEAMTLDDARSLIAKILGCVPSDIPTDARINRFKGWDSLAHVNMMIALEKSTERTIAPNDAVRLISVAAIAQYLSTAAEKAELVNVAELSPDALCNAVDHGLRDIGVAAGDTVLVHSFLAPALMVADAPNIVNRSLLRVLSPDGTLVMPAFTPAFTQEGAIDRYVTPSEMGILTERLRDRADVAISPHPYHRFVALGAEASRLMADHGPSSFGDDSPIARMHRSNAKIVFVSVDWDACVFLHYVEERFGVPYRYDKKFTGAVTTNGAAVDETWTMFVRDLDNGTANNFILFGRRVEAAGLVGRSTHRPFVFKCIDMAALYEFTREALRDDPYCLVARGT